MTARLWLAWALIVIAAAVLIVQAAGYRERARTQTHANNFQLDITSRYAVGCKLCFERNSPTSKVHLGRLAAEVRSKATTPLDRLRIIPVIAELEGRDAGRLAAGQFLNLHRRGDLFDDAMILQRGYAFGAGAVQSRELRQLEQRHGWYGQLAVSQIDPSDGPARAEAESAAKRTIITLGSVIVFGAFFFIVGVVALVLFFVRRGEGKLPAWYRPSDPSVADVLVEGFALYLCLMAALGIAARFLPSGHFELNLLLLVPVLAGVSWVRARGVWGVPLAAAIGWNTGRGVAREVFAGIVGYVAGIPLMAIGMVAFVILSRFGTTLAYHPIEYEIASGGWMRVSLFVLACVFAPVTEELMFRGLLLRQLSVRWPRMLAAVVVSLLFAAIHPQGWAAIPLLGTMGLVLAVIRLQRDSLLAGMAAHALNNAPVLIVMITAAG